MSLKRMRWGGGFTLVEIVVALGIFIVISAMTASFFIQGAGLWSVIIDQSDLRSVARNAMNYMTQELQKATRTTSGTPSPNLSVPAAPDNNAISFYLPKDSDDDGNELIIDDVGITEWDTDTLIQYQYASGSKQLRRLENGDNITIVANNVALIEFEDNSIDSGLYDNELRIILTLERLTPQQRTVSTTLTSLLKLRN